MEVLAGFVEEVDAAGGPLHPAAATGERSRAPDLVSQLVQKGIGGDEALQPFVAHELHAFFPDLLPRLEFAWPDLVAREVSFVKAHEFRLGHVLEFFAFGLRDIVFLHPGRDISRGCLPVHPPAHDLADDLPQRK